MTTGKHIGPVIDIFRRVNQDLSFPRRSRRRVHPHYIGQGDGDEGPGIVILQILGGCKGESPEIIETLNIFGLDTRFGKFFSIVC